MKKALLSLLMVAALMPFAMAQDNTPRTIVPTNATACQTYTWAANGQTYTTDTVDIYINATNDTLFVLNLSINTPYTNFETVNATRCTYTWRGHTYNYSGLFSDTVRAAANSGLCDSIFNIALVVPTTEVDNENVRACGSYTWHDSILTNSGIYTDTTYIADTVSGIGCTHVDVLGLSLVTSLNVVENVENCGNYRWNDTLRTATGTYEYTVTDTAANCDTVHTLNLTIIVNTANTVVDSACASKTWYNHTFDSTGFYTIYDTNATTQCVTIRTLDLTIKTPRIGHTDTAMVGCNAILFSVSSLAGTTTLRISHDTIFDTSLIDHRMNKCYDSTIHLQVTIHKSGHDSTYANACDSFYWSLNKRTYYKTPQTTPTYPFATDEFGCDSIMDLFLVIKKSPVISAINGEWNLEAGETAVLYPTCTEGATYKWTYGNQTSTNDTLRIENVQANIDVALEATITYNDGIAYNNAVTFACHDTSWITIVTFVGINGTTNANVTLYPNPVVGQLNIDCAEPIRQVAIFNTLGQQVLLSHDLGTSSVMNLSNLNKGTYTMRISLENGETIIRKFIITK